MTATAPHDRFSLARRLGLGRLAMRCYYRPKSWLAAIGRTGLRDSARQWCDEQAMRRAARRLPAWTGPAPAAEATEICFLTGHDYWHQTIFCAHSLLRQTGRPLRISVLDDGTLRPAELRSLARALPLARVHAIAEIEQRLARRLPRDRYPLIWYYRAIKPLFRKITDVFACDPEWRLLLDSDMLFFRKPAALLEWLESPARPCYMTDVASAYGYSRPLLESLAGAPLAECVNIGIFGFSGRLVDWDRLEKWIEQLTTREGLPYNFTQALSAMLIAGQPCTVLDKMQYRMLPDETETAKPTAVLHHYVAGSKKWYFRHGWRHVSPPEGNSPVAPEAPREVQGVGAPGPASDFRPPPARPTSIDADLAALGRRLRLGRAMYLFWHRPRAAAAQSRRAGGPWHQWLDARGRRAMQVAARHLTPVPAPAPGAPEIVFLTGRQFWFQTAFCCRSLRQVAARDLQPVFIDDGTFDDALRREARRLFPGSIVRDCAAIERHLDTHLPEAKFPALRRQRRTYIHLRKLTDAHAGLTGWRLVLDSDMLFFRRPDALLDWLAAPDRSVHMLDVQDAYGYPHATLAQLAARPLPAKLNVGICGLRSEAIDWPQMEAWCAELLGLHGTSYYLEQALVALWLSREAPLRLDAADYRLLPPEDECRAPRAVMHHYVDLSKRGYFRHAWHKAPVS